MEKAEHWYKMIRWMNNHVYSVISENEAKGVKMNTEILEHFVGVSNAINSMYKTHDVVKEIEEYYAKPKKTMEAMPNVR